jgi:lactococcin 972 family bacteriocin
MKKTKIFTGVILALTMATIGTAAAAQGSEQVGGGQWSWSTIPGVRAVSSYYHSSNTHSASAQVGSSAIAKDIQGANITAKASKSGIGTTRVWWNNQA